MTEAIASVFLWPKGFLQLSGGSWVFMTTILTTMKKNTYLLLILLTAPVVLALGASLTLAFTSFVAVSMLGMTSNDYAENRYNQIGTAI